MSTFRIVRACPSRDEGLGIRFRALELFLALVNFPVVELSPDLSFHSDSGHQVLSPRAEGIEPGVRCSLSTLVEPVYKAGAPSTLVEPIS